MWQLSRRAFLASSAAAAATSWRRSAAAPAIREVPWLAEIQTPPLNSPTSSSRASQLRAADGSLIETREQWQQQREKLRRWWLEFLGPLPPREKTPKLEVLEEEVVQGVRRQRVRYEVEPGITTEAYLLQPAAPQEKLPGVAVFHSTVDHSLRQPAGVEGAPEKAFGFKLAQRGCVTLCPRNYLWPTSDKIAASQEAARFQERYPASRGMARMLHDALLAVDILASWPQVDARRLGSVGHSLGAKEVLYLAALDERVKVTVSSEGGIGTSFSNWDAPWYLGESIRAPEFTHDHHELLALVAPRAFLLIGGNSADGDQSWPFIEAALPIYRLYGDPPRLGLFNHKQGHAVPPQAEMRIDEWFATYL